jgi:hypothetical protein
MIDHKVFIREYDNSLVEFDPVELQNVIIQCFEAEDLQDASFMAEDFVLALEYTLRSAPKEELIFDRREITSSVIQILEEAGFPTVAEKFKSSTKLDNKSSWVKVSNDVLTNIFENHLACTPKQISSIVAKVQDAIAKLNISSADPHLFLELGRFYQASLATPSVVPSMEIEQPEIAFSKEDLERFLSPECQALIRANVIQLSSVTNLYPCVRFFFSMMNFAKYYSLNSVITELELYPLLFSVGNALAEARKTISQHLAINKEVPSQLHICDLYEFIHVYIGVKEEEPLTLANELANALSAELGESLYKYSFD